MHDVTEFIQSKFKVHSKSMDFNIINKPEVH